MNKKTFLSDLKGIQKSAEIETIKFSVNPLNELIASYNSWCNVAKGVVISIKGHDAQEILNIGDNLYQEAFKITNDKLKGISTKDVISLIKKRKSITLKIWSGLYLSALQNKQIFEELVIENIRGLSFIGYRLDGGRIKIKSDCGDYIGIGAGK